VILLLGAKNPSSEASVFGPGTGSENGVEKTKRLLSVATAGVATSTPETQADDLGLFMDSGNNCFENVVITQIIYNSLVYVSY
jgi:hypothetical protein